MFGEIALLSPDGERQATVTTSAPALLLRLPRPAFEALLRDEPAIREGIAAAAETMLVA
jgi:CRP-like cAMP-binding protein